MALLQRGQAPHPPRFGIWSRRGMWQLTRRKEWLVRPKPERPPVATVLLHHSIQVLIEHLYFCDLIQNFLLMLHQTTCWVDGGFAQTSSCFCTQTCWPQSFVGSWSLWGAITFLFTFPVSTSFLCCNMHCDLMSYI